MPSTSDTRSARLPRGSTSDGDVLIGFDFSPDRRRLVCTSGVGKYDMSEEMETVHVRDAATGETIARWNAETGWTRLIFSADGSKLIGPDRDTASVWDASTGERLASFPGPEMGPHVFDVFPDGRRIVSAGDQVRIWNARTYEPLLTLRGHGKWVADVAVSRDGRRIVSGAEDGTVRIWDTPAEGER